ncbi:hypothetical protein CYMTET_31509 [Cymbomonas tetramitiformis]|uniref:Uncharacterized protein n=1 Tax=Cymbomonas tetramitiformis TaxID=36881 RepID=A0AAE0FH21_9CHLO|nr:hypothetical protein CYMTET_31509 [Cymbomonas tetramitiformis]
MLRMTRSGRVKCREIWLVLLLRVLSVDARNSTKDAEFVQTDEYASTRRNLLINVYGDPEAGKRHPSHTRGARRAFPRRRLSPARLHNVEDEEGARQFPVLSTEELTAGLESTTQEAITRFNMSSSCREKSRVSLLLPPGDDVFTVEEVPDGSVANHTAGDPNDFPRNFEEESSNHKCWYINEGWGENLEKEGRFVPEFHVVAATKTVVPCAGAVREATTYPCRGLTALRGTSWMPFFLRNCSA